MYPDILIALGSPGDRCVDHQQCAGGLCVTDDKNRTYCSRYCNSNPCPAQLPKCVAQGVIADGVNLMACSL